jgi:hypothetical protein
MLYWLERGFTLKKVSGTDYYVAHNATKACVVEERWDDSLQKVTEWVRTPAHAESLARELATV